MGTLVTLIIVIGIIAAIVALAVSFVVDPEIAGMILVVMMFIAAGCCFYHMLKPVVDGWLG